MKCYRLTRLIVFVVACMTISAKGALDEAAALALLASPDAALQDKAMACDELGRMGTAKAVPILAKLLADEKLHDYARDGLERIKDPAAGRALLEALRTLKARQRVGVIISLGDRREKAAVPALEKIAKKKAESSHATGAALSSLALIGTDKAGEAILAVLAGEEAESRVSAARAALVASERMEKDGRQDVARKLRKAVASADVPAYVKKAAER
jgi:hypothetical protein